MRSTVTRLLVGGDLSEPELSEVGAEATRLLAFLATDTVERRLAFVELQAA